MRAHQDAGAFLGGAEMQTATLNPPRVERPGAVIGPYKLLQQIGEGGFGIVFMAELPRDVTDAIAHVSGSTPAARTASGSRPIAATASLTVLTGFVVSNETMPCAKLAGLCAMPSRKPFAPPATPSCSPLSAPPQ